MSRRSASRKQFPGKLDAVVGGAISAGDGPLDTMVKESAEEASLDDNFVRSHVRCTGSLAVSRRTGFGSDDGFVVFPAVIYTYELEFESPELDDQVVRPRTNSRDEVASFELMDEDEVVATIVRGEWAPLPMLVCVSAESVRAHGPQRDRLADQARPHHA